MLQDHETDRLLLRILDHHYDYMVLDFLERNQQHFDRWEPSKISNYYTLEYQRHSLSFENDEIHSFKALRYWIFLKNDPYKIIGSVSFSNITRGCYQNCSLGYKIDKDYLGNSYALEACSKAISILFLKYHLHKINAYIMPNNTPSMRLIKKLGFASEGISYKSIFVQNVWEDHAVFGLINPND